MNLLEGIFQRGTSRPKKLKREQGRIFGKDITNIHKNQSYQQKPNTKMDIETRSRAQSIKKQTIIPNFVSKQMQFVYEIQIINHLIKDNKPCNPILSDQINLKMRAILIDWLVDVHSQFQLKQQTYYLCIRLLDQYCGLEENITRKSLQLLGITCLWIASKNQEIYPPKMRNYVGVTDKACTQQQIHQMQSKILIKLSFKIVKTTLFSYLSSVLGNQLQSSPGCFCRYLLELCILQGLTTQYSTTVLVLSALQVSEFILKRSTELKRFKDWFVVSQEQINMCSRLMIKYLNKSTWQDLRAIRKKYSLAKYHSIGRIQIDTN